MTFVSNLLLLVTALIWGSTFVAQSVGMEHVGPWTFVFSRYVISSLVLVPASFFLARRTGAEKKEKTSRKLYLAGGACCGFFLGLASIAQQIGIQYATAGKTGFITTLYVVLVPVFGLFWGRRPPARIWICVILGLSGLYLISVKEGFIIGLGDSYVLLCAILFSFQIMSVGYFSARVENTVALANVEFVFAGIVGLAGMLLFEEPRMETVLAAGIPILYAGVLSGGIGYTLQIVAQKHTDPAVASLIMSMEAVFSALAGWIVLRQGLSRRELAGCALVFLAVLLAEAPIGAARDS